MINKRKTLSLVRNTESNCNEFAISDEQYSSIANNLTPEQQNGDIVVNQESISDEEAIMMANKLSPESQRHQKDEHNDNRRSKIQARFNSQSSREPDKAQTVDSRNPKVEIEAFEMPTLNENAKRSDPNTGERFHGSGFMGKNRKRRMRLYEEKGITDNQHYKSPKVAVNENPLAKWL